MKISAIVAASAALALAACNGAETSGEGEAAESSEAGDADILEGDAPGFEAVAPGTYDVTQADGSVDSITIHPGMTWSRVSADGSASGGTIFMQGGQTCFVTEGEEGHTCFTDGPAQPDGSMQTTAEDGSVATVRPAEGESEAGSE